MIETKNIALSGVLFKLSVLTTDYAKYVNMIAEDIEEPSKTATSRTLKLEHIPIEDWEDEGGAINA